MTSLPFVIKFKQFYAMFHQPSAHGRAEVRWCPGRLLDCMPPC